MPCINFQIDPCIGPLLDLGVSPPLSLTANGIQPPIVWIKAVADTGATNTCVSPNATTRAGLPLTGQVNVGTLHQIVIANVYSADLFVKCTFGANAIEYGFRDVPITEFAQPSPKNDALLGMDILRCGIFVTNGQTMLATFCW